MATLTVTGRADLSDAQWAVLEPQLPRGKKPGRPPERTKRQLIDGIRWRTRTGAPWRDVPPCYGRGRRSMAVPPLAAERDLAEDPTALQGRADAAGLITWDVSVDSTVARAHQHAAGARRRGDLQAEPPGGVQAEPAASRAGPLPRRADHEGAPGLRAAAETAVRGHHRRAAGRQPAVPAGAGGHRRPAAPGSGTRPDPPGPRPPPTRPTAPAPTAPTCADAGSGARFRRRPIRSAPARPKAAGVAARLPSTPTTTRPATPWSAASADSSATVLWPPATTSWPSATKPPSMSPQSTNGSYPLMKHAPRGQVRVFVAEAPACPTPGDPPYLHIRQERMPAELGCKRHPGSPAAHRFSRGSGEGHVPPADCVAVLAVQPTDPGRRPQRSR